MSEIVADPLSPSCYLLLAGPRIKASQRLGADPLLRRTHAREVVPDGLVGQMAGVRRNPYLNLAADSLQIAQTVKDRSI